MNNAEKFGLSLETINLLKSIFFKYPQIENVLIYGSRAKGNFKEGSDIDLVIKGALLTTTDLLKIENDIEELMLPYKVDLALFHQIENVELVEHINRVGIQIFK